MSEITGQIRAIFHNSGEAKIPARLTLKGFDGYFNTFNKKAIKDLKVGDEVEINYSVKTSDKGTLNNINSIELFRKQTDKGLVATKWPETKVSSEEAEKQTGSYTPLPKDFIPADLLKSDPRSEHIDNAVILKELAATYIEGLEPKSEEDFEFLAKKFRKFLNTGNWI